MFLKNYLGSSHYTCLLLLEVFTKQAGPTILLMAWRRIFLTNISAMWEIQFAFKYGNPDQQK